MSHCALEATLKPIRLLKFKPETVVSNVVVAQVCWEAVPNTWPCGTAHDLSVDERSRRLRPSETKCMSSAKYGGALPDNDEKTKHASLKSTCLWTGNQCNWRKTGDICSPRLAPVRSQVAAFWTDWTFQIRLWDTTLQWITIVQATWYERLDECSVCFMC